MYSCINNITLLRFDMIIYTTSQQAIIILYSIVLYCAYGFNKLMTLSLRVNLHNTLKDAKNIMFNLPPY